jgi:hypothetical protein
VGLLPTLASRRGCVARQGDKHSPRVDEHMEREVESLLEGALVSSRSEEYREQQPWLSAWSHRRLAWV